MRRSVAILVLIAATAGAVVGAPALGERLAERRVTTPSGVEVAVFDEATGVLDRGRLEACLATIGESGAWPEVWLVVQDESTSWDLALHLVRTDDGVVVPGEVAALPRSEWDARALKAALREVLGRKPAAKVRDVVVQGFRKRVVTVYPYQAENVDRTRGLMALLPEGTVLREARTVDLGDGVHRTLALVLREARFEPADCSTPLGVEHGHLDRGSVHAYLVGAGAVEDELDLTPYLDLDGEGALSRYRCAEGESPATLDPTIARTWIATREPRSLLVWTDVDGDGRALEILLPDVTPEGAFDEVVLGVGPGGPTLRVVDP